MSYNSKIVANIGWLFFDRFYRMLGGAIVGVLLARYLGPEGFGVLNYSAAIAGLAAAFATLGLDEIIVRTLVKEPTRRGVLMGSALFGRVVAGSAMLAVVQIVTWISRPGESQVHVVVALTSVATIMRLIDVMKPWFDAQVRSKVVVLSENAAFTVATLLRIILLWTKAPLWAFAAAILIEVIIGRVVLWMVFWAEERINVKIELSFGEIIRLLKVSWPLILSSVAFMFSMRTDQVMLSYLLGDKEVGLYAAAARIAEIWYFVPLAIITSLFPNIIQAHERSRSVFFQRFQAISDLLVSLAVAIGFLTTFVAGFLISSIYGEDYLLASSSLRILIWSGIFVFFGTAWSKWMLIEGRTKIILSFQIVGAVANIFLNLLLIPRMGIAGAALATLVSYSFGHLILAAFIPSQREAWIVFLKCFFPYARLVLMLKESRR